MTKGTLVPKATYRKILIMPKFVDNPSAISNFNTADEMIS